MECYWTLFNNRGEGEGGGGQNGNCSTPNHAWEESQSMVDSSTSHWSNFPTFPPPDSFMMHPGGEKTKLPHFFNPDPHFTCLELGKRHYFEPPPVPAKKGKGGGYSECAVVVPRCQVEGCAAVLVNAKDYHRRHKVCEMHAKAPKVVVLGTQQRFCQQCSRFHAVGEFDEAKRSCRRRLAGHNERRRKTSQQQNALARKQSQGRESEVNNSECALSLLSSNQYWNVATTSPDLPARCSAALRELIAENRASILASRQLNNGQAHVTLNLMQAPNSAFGLVSMHDHNSNSKDAEQQQEDCSHLWKLPLGY